MATLHLSIPPTTKGLNSLGLPTLRGDFEVIERWEEHGEPQLRVWHFRSEGDVSQHLNNRNLMASQVGALWKHEEIELMPGQERGQRAPR